LTDSKGVSKTIKLTPSSYYDFVKNTYIYRFQPCIEIKDNQFIPVAGESYSICAKLYIKNALRYIANGGEKLWTVPADFAPIVPEVEIITGEGFEIINGMMSVTSQTAVIAASEEAYGWHSYRDKITEIVVADGITEIGARAFSHCLNLEKITFGKDVTILNMDTISYCSSLKTIVFNGKITSVGQGVVYQTENITSVTLTNQTKAEFLALLTSPYNDAFKSSSIAWYTN
ncbi:MAG: leucine-rich repeat protein, partial [Clostridia bacterium]|nr:leucine-rich repeat protein [Clostridia bacterium]